MLTPRELKVFSPYTQLYNFDLVSPNPEAEFILYCQHEKYFMVGFDFFCYLAFVVERLGIYIQYANTLKHYSTNIAYLFTFRM